MPELPEVETIVRDLAPHLSGRRIVSAEFRSQLTLRHCAEPIAGRLAGQQIQRLERRGKFIVLRLEEGALVVHLGMTGKLLLEGEPGKHTRAIFHLDKGKLLFNDIRMFGSIEWAADLPERMSRLGPEPFDMSPVAFAAALRKRNSAIKPVLLNQSVLRGVGNIYADEALYRAKIHPRRRANRISGARAARLHASIVEVLLDAIEHRGSSIANYVGADGSPGGFQLRHLAYGREGQPCVRCQTPIRKIVLGGRGTHYCPRCQV